MSSGNDASSSFRVCFLLIHLFGGLYANAFLNTTWKEIKIENTVNQKATDKLQQSTRTSICHPLDSCKEENSDINRLCKCNQKCIEYKDCCRDSDYYDEEKMRESYAYECLQVSADVPRILVKVSCDLAWKGEEISSKCAAGAGAGVASPLDENLNTEELELGVPVSSYLTDITYKNVFCAICNYDDERLLAWQLRVNKPCESESFIRFTEFLFDNATTEGSSHHRNGESNFPAADLNYTQSDELKFDGQRWYFTRQQENYFCTLNLAIPANFSALEFCKPIQIVDTCVAAATAAADAKDSGWFDFGELQRRCGSSYSVVRSVKENDIGDHEYYRNEYCAYCNGLNRLDIVCAENILPRSVDDSFHRPLQILFDLNAAKPSFTRKLCEEKSVTANVVVVVPVAHSEERLKHQLFCGSEKSVTPETLLRVSFTYFFAWYTFSAMWVSLIFLLAHLTVFSVVKELRTLGGKNLASFCLALALAYANFLAGNYAKGNACFVVSVFTYYCFLTAFIWLLIISYDIWRTFRSVTKKCRSPLKQEESFLKYSATGWIAGLFPVLLCTYLDVSREPLLSSYSPEFAYRGQGCWFQNARSLLFFFVMPVFFIIIVNFAFFTHTTYMIFTSQCKSTPGIDTHTHFTLYARLALLTGVTWITGLVAEYFQNIALWFLFVFLNASQGVFIFLAFTCRKEILGKFLLRCGVRRDDVILRRLRIRLQPQQFHTRVTVTLSPQSPPTPTSPRHSSKLTDEVDGVDENTWISNSQRDTAA